MLVLALLFANQAKKSEMYLCCCISNIVSFWWRATFFSDFLCRCSTWMWQKLAPQQKFKQPVATVDCCWEVWFDLKGSTVPEFVILKSSQYFATAPDNKSLVFYKWFLCQVQFCHDARAPATCWSCILIFETFHCLWLSKRLDCCFEYLVSLLSLCPWAHVLICCQSVALCFMYGVSLLMYCPITIAIAG